VLAGPDRVREQREQDLYLESDSKLSCEKELLLTMFPFLNEERLRANEVGIDSKLQVPWKIIRKMQKMKRVKLPKPSFYLLAWIL